MERMNCFLNYISKGALTYAVRHSFVQHRLEDHSSLRHQSQPSELVRSYFLMQQQAGTEGNNLLFKE